MWYIRWSLPDLEPGGRVWFCFHCYLGAHIISQIMRNGLWEDLSPNRSHLSSLSSISRPCWIPAEKKVLIQNSSIHDYCTTHVISDIRIVMDFIRESSPCSVYSCYRLTEHNQWSLQIIHPSLHPRKSHHPMSVSLKWLPMLVTWTLGQHLHPVTLVLGFKAGSHYGWIRAHSIMIYLSVHLRSKCGLTNLHVINAKSVLLPTESCSKDEFIAFWMRLRTCFIRQWCGFISSLWALLGMLQWNRCHIYGSMIGFCSPLKPLHGQFYVHFIKQLQCIWGHRIKALLTFQVNNSNLWEMKQRASNAEEHIISKPILNLKTHTESIIRGSPIELRFFWWGMQWHGNILFKLQWGQFF